MHIINLVSRPQAFDKSLALCSQLLNENTKLSITTIFALPEKQLTSYDFLFNEAANVSNNIVFIGVNSVHKSGLAIYNDRGVEYSVLRNPFNILNKASYPFISSVGRMLLDYQFSIGEKFPTSQDQIYLFKSHHHTDQLSQYLVKKTQSMNGEVCVYLNGDYPPGENIPIKYFEQSGSDPELADNFLLYSNTHAHPIREYGYTDTVTIGYPKLYPSWINRINQAAAANHPSNDNILVLTRGEHGSPPYLVTHEALDQILNDIYEVITSNSVFTNPRMIIKPHPRQDLASLKKMTENIPIADISYKFPALLAAQSKLAITTFSGTAVDAITVGTPTIEYIRETDFFNEMYPNGSPYQKMGVEGVSDKNSLDVAINEVMNKEYRLPNIHNIFGQEKNLNYFSD